MPSMTHEGLATLFRSNPHLATGLVADRLTIPEGAQIKLEDATFGEVAATEYRADAVVAIADAEGQLLQALVVEVQLGRDLDKRYTWPNYLTSLRVRLRCPADLLVVTVDRAIAQWCGRAIPVGSQGFELTPWVIGPEQLPGVELDETERERLAAMPELGVLAVAAHGREPGAESIGVSALASIAELDDERSRLYTDLVYFFLNAAARAALESMMQSGNYQYQSDFARKYYSEGRTEGLAKGLLVVLRVKGFAVSPRLQAHIEACRDADRLALWYQRAEPAAELADIFTDIPERAVLDQE